MPDQVSMSGIDRLAQFARGEVQPFERKTDEGERYAIEPKDHRPGPDERVLQGEAVLRVRNALVKLPPRIRAVIVLRDLSPIDWTLEELGEALKVSRERVRQMREQAFDAMRDDLDAQDAAQQAQTPPRNGGERGA